MIIKNKLDKAFEPVGSSTGMFMLIGGIVATYYSPIGIILIILGALVGFTSTSTLLDTDKRKLKFSNNLFGIIPSGKWIDIKAGMNLGLKKSHTGYRTYSRSNRKLDIHINDTRIVLLNARKKQIMQIAKFNSVDDAKKELAKYRELLNLKNI